MGSYSHITEDDFCPSNKGDKIIAIKTYIVDKIRKNQNIQRYCFYLTKQPTARKSVNYKGDVIYQRDLNIDLTQENTVNVGADPNDNTKTVTVPASIIPYAYNDKMISEEQVIIFIHNYQNDLKNLIGENIVAVDVLVPYVYDQIQPKYGQRLYKIVREIIEEFDDVDVEEEFVEDLGNLHFTVVGDSNGKGVEQRINKTNEILIYTLFITTSLINGRRNENGYL